MTMKEVEVMSSTFTGLHVALMLLVVAGVVLMRYAASKADEAADEPEDDEPGEAFAWPRRR